MTPSWYDVLGVEEDATAAEIRAAWQESVAGLDPTDRRFKQRNRAAEVLLDPAKRAAHDLDLAARAGDEDDEDDGAEEADVDGATSVAAPPAGETATAATPARTRPARPARPTRLTKPAATTATTTATAPTTVTAGDDEDVAEPTRDPVDRRRPLTLVLGVLALLLVVATVVSLVNGGGSDDEGAPAATSLPDTREVQAARRAAETAIGPVLSYDFRDLEASRSAATAFMTPAYTEVYEQNFAGFIEENAPATQTIVTAEVVDSGIVRTGDDRVDVLVFVNRPTRNASGDSVSRDQVTVRMLDVGGSWLVDCLITQPGDSCGE